MVSSPHRLVASAYAVKSASWIAVSGRTRLALADLHVFPPPHRPRRCLYPTKSCLKMSNMS